MDKKRCRYPLSSLDYTKTQFFFRSKQAQVTVFIIIGIVLLLVLALVILTRQEILQFSPDEIIPTEKGKVETSIRSCMEQIGEEAVQKLGIQAGYINVPSDVERDGSRHLRVSPFQVVPYWAQGEERTIPSVEQMSEEINVYVEQNLRGCLNADESFSREYDVREKSDIEATTSILEEKIVFAVRWEVEVRTKSGEVVAELINHDAQSAIKLKKVYDTAVQIVDAELREMKVEDITQDLLALEHPNVPLAGVAMGCTRKEWNVREVKQTVQDMLRVNLAQLRVKGTEFVEFPNTLPYYQNHYVWDVGEEFTKPDVSVQFRYENTYPFLFQVTPQEGNWLRSSSVGGTDLLSFLCVQTWKFTYDVVYPVQVIVRDDTTGYLFRTAFTVHLVRNLPNRESDVVARESRPLNFVTDEKFCANRRVPMTVRTWELIENEKQGIYSSEPLSGTTVSYTCLKYRCDIGESTFNFQNTGYQAGVTGNFPYCVGGIVRAEKPGYTEDWERVTAQEGATTDLYLIPLFSFPATKVNVMQHDVTDLRGVGKSLPSDDVVLVRLRAFKQGKEFHHVEQLVGGALDEKALEKVTLDFLAGADFEYRMEVDVFERERLIGGYRGNWTVDWDDLSTAEEMVIHVATTTEQSDEELFAFMAGLEENSKRVPLPEFGLAVPRGGGQR